MRGLKRRLASPLTRRILALNILPILVLAVGMMQLDQYRDGLVEAELAALATHAETFAAALGESAVREGSEEEVVEKLRIDVAQQMLRRMSSYSNLRARLFAPEGKLLIDSDMLLPMLSWVEVSELPLSTSTRKESFTRAFRQLYDRLSGWLPSDAKLPLYVESREQQAGDYPEVIYALHGEETAEVRITSEGQLMLSVAVPVQRYKRIIAVIMVSSNGDRVEERLFEVRATVIAMSLLALATTILLSFYLAGTIANPLKRLALAAERLRHGHTDATIIPDFSRRGDEIGELSLALRDMTEALWQRMAAIEGFAADVAHEIKNPLSSIRSATETLARIEDPKQRQKLLNILLDDVKRLDRLISEISDASRLDAELVRTKLEPVALAPLLKALTELHAETQVTPPLKLMLPENDELVVQGGEGRLAQVFRNLITNAISFSPEKGEIIIIAERKPDGFVNIAIGDDGPGIPPGKEAAVFERFYSERPKSEKYGTHSGLGLSISKQIVDAYGGTISAANRFDAPHGAVFTVRLRGG
jgi:two-component system sensor histidine kinase ChvG